MRSRIINMTVPAELIKEVDELAEAEGRTRSELFREAARRYLHERRPRKKDASRLLSRLASLAVKGPRLDAGGIDRLLYRAARHR